MYAILRPRFNTGLAMVGAGAIALTPLVVPPTASPLRQATLAVMRDANLLAVSDPMLDLGTTLTGSLNGLLGGLATALDLDVTLDANGGVSLPDFFTAVVARLVGLFTGGMDGDPLAGLMNLINTAITTVIGFLTGMTQGGVAPSPGMDTVAQFVAAPFRLGLDALQTGNTAAAGLINNGIDLGASLLPQGLDSAVAFLNNAITTGASFASGVVTGVGSLLTNGATMLATALAPLEAIPVVGTAVAAFRQIVSGFAAAGADTFAGIASGINSGAVVLTQLITDAVTMVNHPVTGGAGVLTGAVSTGSTAMGNVLSGFQNALDEVVPPPDNATTAAAATQMRAAIRAGASSPAASASLPSPAKAVATARANARAAASQTATDITGVIKAGTAAGVDLGKAVSRAATGKVTVKGTGDGSASAGGSATGATSASASGTGKASASAGGRSGAHANGHASGHARAGK